MRFGLHVPQLGALGEPDRLLDLAERADRSGWEGFFVWDHVMHAGDPPACDPWVALGAIAVRTGRLRLGPLVTPVPRRRPWKLAREAVTLDRLSQGRAVLGVGIGTDAYGEFEKFDEPAVDDRGRAARLDEGLAVIAALWEGRRVTHAGEHYVVRDVVHTPRPVQTPRIPVWCAVVWPHRRPLQRAARWDGVVPVGRLEPGDVTEMVAAVRRQRPDDQRFDVVLPSAATTGAPPAAYAAAGATWWLASLDGGDLAGARALVDAGPPTLAG
jgi:alkanesulfonate monooxygenase SsuD/methylene tetrahydromethanopterin reductase-like flavin-dependent oxidoreductase (luciferase family)